MGHSAPDAAHYKPTINIAQAPPADGPLLYIGSAYGFLIAAAVLLIIYRAPLVRGDYGDPRVIMVVHFFTLGFLSMTAMGILTQWIPVVFDVPPLGVKRTAVQFSVYLAGVLGFAWGLAQQNWVLLAVSGTVLAIAIVMWSAGAMGQLAESSKPRDTVYRGIQGAVAGFNLTWVMGVFMALSFLGWWPEYQVLRVHIATALAAWLGMLVLTVQVKLNPMFSMSKAEGVRPALPLYLVAAGVVLAWGSLFTSALLMRAGAVLWTAAAVVAAAQLARTVRQGKAERFDRVFVGVGAAWLLLLAAAVEAVWLSPLAIFLAFWALLTLIFSYQARIVPFVVAVAVAKKLPGPVFKAFFMAQAMHSKSQPVVVGILGITGAALSVAGRMEGTAGLEAASGAAVLVMVISQLANMGAAMARGRRQGAAHP